MGGDGGTSPSAGVGSGSELAGGASPSAAVRSEPAGGASARGCPASGAGRPVQIRYTIVNEKSAAIGMTAHLRYDILFRKPNLSI